MVANSSLTSQSYCIFIQKAYEQDNFDAMCHWLKLVSGWFNNNNNKSNKSNNIIIEKTNKIIDFEVMLCRKGHMIQIDTKDIAMM